MLKEQFMKDLKQSMIEKDELRKNTIVMLRATVIQIEKDKKITLSEEEILDVVSKEIKKRLDVIPSYEKLDRQESVKALNKEIDILKTYLPEQLTMAEIIELVEYVRVETNSSSIKDMGRMMQLLKPKIAGKADGKLVSEIVRDVLKGE